MKTFYFFILLVVMCGSGSVFGTSFSDPNKPTESKGVWVKSEKGVWLGGYNRWYKIDRKNNSVKLSHNKKRWNTAPNAAWQGKQGQWLYIYEGKLMSNSDGRWIEITDKAWQDMNGKWYRFNSDWELEETAEQESFATAN